MQPGLQSTLLDLIIERHSKRAEAVDALCQLLNVGKDAIYRRMRGDTLLAPDEIALLSKHYSISLDAIALDKSDTVIVNYNVFSKKVNSFKDYLDGVYNQLLEVSQLPNAKITYASSEIPVFMFMYIPELICFKLYIWGMTTWDFDFLQDRKFSFDLIAFPYRETVEKIMKLYNHLPTTNVWCQSFIDTTINHIEYIHTIGKFADPQDALRLCDDLSNMVGHMRVMAEHGKKFPLGVSPEAGSVDFNLYYNELSATSNTILAETDIGDSVFITHASPNFFSSTDKKLCEHTKKYLKDVIAKSNSITQHSSKDREWFFGRLERKIKLAKQRLAMAMEEEF